MLAVVILNYNDGELTKNYAEKLSSMKIVDKIVVVDNCSTDNSKSYLNSLNLVKKITVIYSDRNGGYAAGNNVGLKYIETNFPNVKYVIISNPDIMVHEKDIDNIIKYMNKENNAFAMTGIVYNRNDVAIKNFRYKLPTCGLLFLESSCLLRRFGSIIGLTRQYKNICKGAIVETEAMPGCFFVARFNILKMLQYFDESTFLYFEEDILFKKAKIKGYKSYIVTESKIIHLEGVSICKGLSSWLRRDRIYKKSSLVYMENYLGVGKILRFIYCIWNDFFVFERYLNAKIRTKYL